METSKEYLSAYYRAYSRAEVARNAAARGESIVEFIKQMHGVSVIWHPSETEKECPF